MFVLFDFVVKEVQRVLMFDVPYLCIEFLNVHRKRCNKQNSSFGREGDKLVLRRRLKISQAAVFAKGVRMDAILRRLDNSAAMQELFSFLGIGTKQYAISSFIILTMGKA